jgi:hypothetical protein
LEVKGNRSDRSRRRGARGGGVRVDGPRIGIIWALAIGAGDWRWVLDGVMAVKELRNVKLEIPVCFSIDEEVRLDALSISGPHFVD